MTSKMQILDKVIPMSQPTAIPLQAACGAFNCIVEARYEYKKIAAQEKTKRAAIDAWEKVRLTELKNQKEILQLYLENTFKERREMINGLFDALDKGIDTGNATVIDQAINGIINIAKDSPLQQVDKLLLSLKNDDVKVIEF